MRKELDAARAETDTLEKERTELRAQIENGDDASATAIRQLEQQNVSTLAKMASSIFLGQAPACCKVVPAAI